MISGGKQKASEQAAELIASYARWRAGSLGQITEALEQQLLVELLGPIAGKTLLDVGCGDGALAVDLARRGAAVTGLDSDPTMLAAARQRAATAKVQLRLAEEKAEALPFPDAAFDRVLAVAALCFIPDAARAIAEMTRVLKPGGLLIIGELNSHSLWAAYRRMRGWFGHPLWRPARFRSPAELRRLVSQAGLDVLEMRGATYYPPCGAAARLLAPVDPWLGRRTTLGAAFIALSAAKPAFSPKPGDATSSLRRALSPEPPRQKSLNFYERWILPPLLDSVMRQSQLEKYRREVVAPARGRVLEIGVGSGLNFLFIAPWSRWSLASTPRPACLSWRSNARLTPA